MHTIWFSDRINATIDIEYGTQNGCCTTHTGFIGTLMISGLWLDVMEC